MRNTENNEHLEQCKEKQQEVKPASRHQRSHCKALQSHGEAQDKHSNRLGKFVKYGASNNKRFSYRQQTGESYLYWQKGVWMVRKIF